MARRRERILGFDRLTGIEIADLADRLMEVWPGDGEEDGDIAQAREHVDALDGSVERLSRLVADLRAEIERLEADRAELASSPVLGQAGAPCAPDPTS